jgi:transcriptional regulator with XRE-family HTH domain
VTAELLQEVRERHAMPGPAAARKIREKAGVSRRQLAEALAVDGVTIWRWESGHRTPRGDRRRAYARLLADLAEMTGK